jgi:4-hydroxyphenylacetate 3-monooxygenase/4-hydroxybutyryl-CoA dehydratase/vinylacetyl-CoA-Delta-isomerase
MRTPEEYEEKLRRMKKNVYVDGELVSRDDPRITPSTKVLSLTYRLATDPEYSKLLTTRSHLTGTTINRFNAICRSPEDLLAKQKMIRLLCRLTGGCIQRCMGCDAINALSIVTREVDEKHGTDYHKRFTEYLKYFQDEDLLAAAAQTDVKGHRLLRPHQQHDPDLYVRVVERRHDGIVVRGAKNNITMAANADEIIVIPTRAMTEKDRDWAVAFAVPADAEGVKLITHSARFRRREYFDSPLSEYGATDSFVVFDDVFVPWDRVFLCGEYEFAGRLALAFATYHRHSYTGCKPAFGDVLIGLASLVADYQGITGREHVRGKLAELISTAELVYAAGIASAVECVKTSSGTVLPNPTYVNVGRRHAGLAVPHEYEILVDLSGGLPSTLPFEGDFVNPETKKYLDKYIVRRPEVPPENVHRCFRLVSDLIASDFGGFWFFAAIHGGGSPIMEEIVTTEFYDVQSRRELAEYLAGIRKEPPKPEIRVLKA